MFEKEIHIAKEQLSEILLTGSPLVSLREIEQNERVHPFYKGFFSAEADWWIFEQAMLRESNTRFDFKQETIKTLIENFDTECRAVARFDHQDLTALIDLAVKTRVNFLFRPRTTLRWFVFRGEPTKLLRETLLRLSYFNEYPYLIQGIKEWANGTRRRSSPRDILSVVEFERAVQSIDNDVILDYTTEEFTQLIQPIYEFFTEIYPNRHAESGIPTPALIIFLDDKGITPIAQEVEKLLNFEKMNYITKERFLHIIEEVISEAELQTNEHFADNETLPLHFDHEPKITEEIAAEIEEEIAAEIEEEIAAEIEEEITEEVTENMQGIPAGKLSAISESLSAAMVAFSVETEDVSEEEAEEEAENFEEEYVEISEEHAEIHASLEEILSERSDEKQFEPAEIHGADSFMEWENEEISTEHEKDFPDIIVPELPHEPDRKETVDEILHRIDDEIESENEEIVQSADDELVAELARDLANFLPKKDNIWADSEEKIGIKVAEDEVPPEDFAQKTVEEKAEEAESEKAVEEREIPVAIEESVAEEKEQESSFPSLFGLIDADLKEKFVKKLFQNDKAEFIASLERLDACRSWKEASNFIDKMYVRFDADPFSTLARKFTEIVYNRFVR